MTRAALRFGIVGTGHMAATMAAAIRRGGWGQVVAVCSADKQRAEEFASRNGAGRAYVDVTAFCSDPDVDVVYVANAVGNHAESCLTPLALGKAVVCEKPLALRAADVERMTGAAAGSGAFFMEAMWILMLPAYRRLGELVRTKHLGEPVHLTFDFGYPVEAGDRARLTVAQNGGLLFDRGCYGVALAVALLGPVDRVSADQRPATSAVSLRHRSGATSQITVSAEALLTNSVSVACTGGMLGLEAPSLGAERLWQQPMAAAPLWSNDDDWRARLRRSGWLRRMRSRLRRPRSEWLPYGVGLFDPLLSHVAARLAAGERTSDIVPLSLSLETARILELAAGTR